MLRHLRIILILCVFVSFYSCKEEITDNKPVDEETSAPDVNVIFSNYSLQTVHSFHMDTTSYPENNYGINLNLILDKPENRNQINKMIIVSEEGYGWEFFRNELEGFYSDSLKGYRFNNLIFRFTTDRPVSVLYKVRIFSDNNKAANDYQLIITPDFIYTEYLTHNWYSNDTYQLHFYNSMAVDDCEVVWLSARKEPISRSIVNLPYNSTPVKINNVPSDAFYFYFNLSRTRNGLTSTLKSSPYAIAQRFPENIKIIGEDLSDLEYLSSIKTIPGTKKFVITDRYYNKLFIVDHSTGTVDQKISISSPRCAVFSEFDNKIYIGTTNGTVYSLGLNESTPTMLKKLGNETIRAFSVAEKFLIISCSDGYRVLNMEDNSLTVQKDITAYSSAGLVYNKTNRILYGHNSYDVYRYTFDPVTGKISNFYQKYISSSIQSLWLTPDDFQLILSSGTILNCSPVQQLDLSPYGNLGKSFNDVAFSTDRKNIITLRRSYYSSNPNELTITKITSFEDLGYTEAIEGSPLFVITEGDDILVASRYTGRIAIEKFSYSELLNGGKPGKKSGRDKFYISKKLI